MYYNLFLDDERAVKDVKWVELPLVNWSIVRNYDEFLRIISENGLPSRISFDHDLANEHYQEVLWMQNPMNLNKGEFRYDKMKEKTGFDCAKWLVNYCLDKNLDLPEYYIHTMNPIGAENIKSLFESYTKSRI